jgi:DNA-binding PucR family transcriptional regulator
LASCPKPEQRLLWDTFVAWLHNGGSIAETAEEMSWNPNTVRNRLRRIEQKSGRSIDAPRELAELCLASEVVKNFTAAQRG